MLTQSTELFILDQVDELMHIFIHLLMQSFLCLFLLMEMSV